MVAVGTTLYVFGGPSNELSSFCTLTNHWKRLTVDMQGTGRPTARTLHSMTAVGTRIYLFGGWTDNGASENYIYPIGGPLDTRRRQFLIFPF